MKWCKVCKDRGELYKLLHPAGGVGAEVGVRRGEFSEIVLDRWPGIMHLVDPWLDYPEYERTDSDGTWDDERDYEETLLRMARFGGRAVVHRTTSREASKLSQLRGLDFAYIDANHAHRYVAEDLELWWAALRRGGVLAGHDIMYLACLDVTQAVLDFAGAVGQEVRIVAGSADNLCRDGQVPSWYLVKP